MSPLTGHVGSRVSALVDGQLPDDLAERLWTHVHLCGVCRDEVEREGWVKTRVAGLSSREQPAPDYLQSLLTLGPALAQLPTTHERLPSAETPQRRRTVAAAAWVVGAGSVSAALVGVVALAGPAQTPVPSERRVPAAGFPTPGGNPVQPSSTRTTRPPTAPSPASVESTHPPVGVGVAQRWVTINP